MTYPTLPYPIESYTRGAAFARLLAERILILDGAMGTMIQTYKLTEADFRGTRFAEHGKDVKGNNELLSLVRPDIIQAIHEHIKYHNQTRIVTKLKRSPIAYRESFTNTQSM